MRREDRPAGPPRRDPLRIAAAVGGAFLGAVLLVAAWAKVIDPNAFVDQVRTEHLDFLLPARLVAVGALALEIALGFLLLFGVRRTEVLVAASAVVALFVFLTGRTYVRYLMGLVDESQSCGCFGNLIERTPSEAFWQDVLLLLPSLALAWVRRSRAEDAVPWLRGAAAGGATAALIVLAGLAPSLPLDDLATRLRPGVAAADLCAGKAGKRACLTDLLPDLPEGRHLIVLVDVEDPRLVPEVAGLNQRFMDALDGKGPRLWVVTTAPKEAVERFRLLTGAAFEVQHEAPIPLLRPMYRRLPRSFLVEDGRVTRTWSAIPAPAPIPPGDGG